MATRAHDTTSGTADDGTAGAARTGLSRPAAWTGIALGTALAGLAISNGAALRIGGMPSWLGLVAGAVIVWALIVAAAVALAELTRRHHKTARGYVVRHGKRGVLAAGRAARRGGRSLMARAAAWAGPRWQARQRPRSRSGPAAATPPAPDASPSAGGATTTSPAGDRDGGTMPMAAAQPAGGPASRIPPDRRARRTAARAGGTVPAEWGPVVAQAADFEPESDGHLLDWMAGQVTGMAAYAEALIEAYQTGVGTVGIDPKGLAALHDVADAAAHAAAETMSGAKTQFAGHYELPREFAGNGGLMTHDGRWITGEGS